MTDPYARKFVDALKSAKNDQDRESIVNRIYEDGFEDGANEG